MSRGAGPVIAPGGTIGIFGGGQLGRMIALAARQLGYGVVVLDPDVGAPARGVADRSACSVARGSAGQDAGHEPNPVGVADGGAERVSDTRSGHLGHRA
jgi:hypothetical protein